MFSLINQEITRTHPLSLLHLLYSSSQTLADWVAKLIIFTIFFNLPLLLLYLKQKFKPLTHQTPFTSIVLTTIFTHPLFHKQVFLLLVIIQFPLPRTASCLYQSLFSTNGFVTLFLIIIFVLLIVLQREWLLQFWLHIFGHCMLACHNFERLFSHLLCLHVCH